MNDINVLKSLIGKVHTALVRQLTMSRQSALIQCCPL